MFTTLLFLFVGGFLLKREADEFDAKAEGVWRSIQIDFVDRKPASNLHIGELARFVVLKNQATARLVIGQVLQIVAIILVPLVARYAWFSWHDSDWGGWLL